MIFALFTFGLAATVAATRAATEPATRDLQSAPVLSRSPNRLSNLDKRDSYVGCTPAQQQEIYFAALQADQAANIAAESIVGPSPELSLWFGVQDGTGLAAIKTVYQRMAGTFTLYKYDCTCVGTPGEIANIVPAILGTINICAEYWNLPAQGFNSKSDTLIHEASHFIQIGDTLDHAYSVAGAQALALSDPVKAAKNAATFQYYSDDMVYA